MVEFLKRSVEGLAPPVCASCSVSMHWYRSMSAVIGTDLISHFFRCPNCEVICEKTSSATGYGGTVLHSLTDPASPKLHQGNGGVVVTASQCRRFAEECIDIAETVGKEHAASLHRMTSTWLELVEELLRHEKLLKRDQNASTPHTQRT